MKQILQNLKSGIMELADVPCPQVGRGIVLIETRASLISAGTERMLVEFSQANLVQKARQQPEKVKQVLDKLRTDGILPTLEAVFNKLDEPLPLGYCNMGVVVDVGPGVEGLQPGDRVISNGPHAEMVGIPKNLCAKVPDGVSDEDAAFTVLGSIALQGVRLAMPTLGERFIVFGLGLVGLMTVQLLRAHGCEVLGIDINAERLRLAERFGARTINPAAGTDTVVAAEAWTGGCGVDGVIITASAKTDDIVHQAAQSCRKRGRIILVGVVGLNLRRSDFYEKELTFQVSCSYGPGRYDEGYEQAGQDYPLGYVRWTEQRNFEAVLGAIRSGALQIGSLVTHRLPFGKALDAYDTLQKDPHALGILLQYPGETKRVSSVRVNQTAASPSGGAIVGVIGAGNFAKAILLPALAKTSARIAYVADLNGAAATHAAKKIGAEQAVTDYKLILADPAVNAVFILVGHHLHARFVCEAIEAGKHVFVEKPLALNELELLRVAECVDAHPDRFVMLGFNRRFSRHTQKMKELLAGRSEPVCMNMTVNAGAIPASHWVQDPERGGGRIIGEGCHFIDLLAYLAGSPVVSIYSAMVGEGPSVRGDKISMVMQFEDGSIGNVNYLANGSKSYPKELLEVFSDGRVLRMENFRVTRGYGFNRFSKLKTFRQDKGHREEVLSFVKRVADGGAPLIPFSEILNTTRASFAAVESAQIGKPLQVKAESLSEQAQR